MADRNWPHLLPVSGENALQKAAVTFLEINKCIKADGEHRLLFMHFGKERIYMRIDRLTSISHPVYNRAMELYRLSFPFHEQRETPSQKSHPKGRRLSLRTDPG